MTKLKYKTKQIMLASSLGVIYSALFTVAVQAQSAIDSARGGVDDLSPGGTPEVESVVATAISLFSLVVGIAAVIMLIIGGFKYIISSGDSNNINSAKNTILYAIIGLVIAALAQVLVRFVLGRLS
ncbi:MAG: pilin [Candidatus Saccharibacteria bacterium]|nr:pilin [Candidatus Saccharibacteria bacterium]